MADTQAGDAYQANFFENGKLNLRLLRHEMNGALGVAVQMLEVADHDPSKRASCHDLIRAALHRLALIQKSLSNENYKASLIDKSDFVQVTMDGLT